VLDDRCRPVATAGGPVFGSHFIASGARAKASTLAFRIDARAFVPYLGLYGDYRFSSDSALPVAPGLVGISDGWSARVTGCTAISAPNGGSLTLDGEVGNLGGGDQRSGA